MLLTPGSLVTFDRHEVTCTIIKNSLSVGWSDNSHAMLICGINIFTSHCTRLKSLEIAIKLLLHNHNCVVGESNSSAAAF